MHSWWSNCIVNVMTIKVHSSYLQIYYIMIYQNILMLHYFITEADANYTLFTVFTGTEIACKLYILTKHCEFCIVIYIFWYNNISMYSEVYKKSVFAEFATRPFYFMLIIITLACDDNRVQIDVPSMTIENWWKSVIKPTIVNIWFRDECTFFLNNNVQRKIVGIDTNTFIFRRSIFRI